MKFIFKNIWQLIAFTLLIILVIQNSCSQERDCGDEIEKMPVIQYNNVVPTHKPEPEIIILNTTKIVTKWKVKWKTKWEKDKHDSTKIKELYQKYYGISVYDEYVVKDSLCKVKINDSISQNQIQSRHVEWSVIPQIYEKRIVEPPRIKLYAGFAMGGGVDQFGFSPKLYLQDKKNHIYSGSYNIITKYTEFGVAWLISFRKK